MDPQRMHQETLILVALAIVVVSGVVAYLKRGRLGAGIDALGRFFSPEPKVNGSTNWNLFWISFAALFIEIMMIRWIGTEVRVFAYFQNLALIACFLGFGLGCYWAGKHKSLVFSLLAIFGLAVLVEIQEPTWQSFLATISTRLSLSADAALWGSAEQAQFVPTVWFMLFAASVVAVAIFLLLLVVVMIPLGQWVGYYLDHATNPIQAYSSNLLGSVAGIWVFAGMAFLRLSPAYWFVAAMVLLFLMPPRSKHLVVASLIVGVGILSLFAFSRHPGASTFWSPYQKLVVVPGPYDRYTVLVNNTGYMHIANMTPAYLSQHPEIAESYKTESSYDAPYRFAKSAERVLIVGAGAGNDAAAALRNGATYVDAVEIDPVIFSLGERLHAEKPYSSLKVHKILNDARAFLRGSKDKYDVIMFGLLDSHTQFSDYSNMRIDNYVYTEEAFRQARARLKPDGILVVKFEVRNPWTWMGERFNSMLAGVFGHSPVVFYEPDLGALPSATVFIESDDPGLWQRSARPELAAIVAKHPPAFSLDAPNPPSPTTDDWPYVYHRGHSIPQTYLTISLILLAMAIFLVRGSLEPGQASTWHFFFLGAGFLLLETQMVSRLALYFGTTWLVNCIALTAILLVLVLANVYVSRHRTQRLVPYYALLVLFLVGNYFLPWHRLPYPARVVGLLLSIAYAVPVFFAGIIFTESFRSHAEKSAAFGANIVGAVAGGLTQNVSFIFGMKILLVFASLFYIAAAVCGLLEARPADEEACHQEKAVV
jgi:spermidine synthase